MPKDNSIFAAIYFRKGRNMYSIGYFASVALVAVTRKPKKYSMAYYVKYPAGSDILREYIAPDVK